MGMDLKNWEFSGTSCPLCPQKFIHEINGGLRRTIEFCNFSFISPKPLAVTSSWIRSSQRFWRLLPTAWISPQMPCVPCACVWHSHGQKRHLRGWKLELEKNGSFFFHFFGMRWCHVEKLCHTWFVEVVSILSGIMT